ncbi:NAD(+) diphosphatase [Sanguibacter gelidistatuariae]|nr:NAD(+) diphosphatase [Sanguibacter gelidistatuariae]
MGYVDWDTLPLSRATTGRGAHRRTEPDVVAHVLTEEGTRVLLVHRGRLAASGDSGGAELVFVAGPATDPALAPSKDVPESQRGAWLYLGEDDAGAFVALVLPDDAGVPAVGLEGIAPVNPAGDLVAAHTWLSLRDLGAALSARDAGLATEAVALAAWHAAHPRCPRCGEPTEPVHGGWVRRCTNDASEHYPRTDPAVIMAVVDDGDRLLLGRAAQWAPGKFSTLAGYVEPGEPLEAAVRREVLEEVGVRIGAVEYRGSQPWPFPASLMLGFVAHATSTEIHVDGDEVVDARWFSRAGLAEAIDAGSVVLPSRTSIARSLIEDWFGAALPGA